MYPLLASAIDAAGLDPLQKLCLGLAMLAGFFYLTGRKPKKRI